MLLTVIMLPFGRMLLSSMYLYMCPLQFFSFLQLTSQIRQNDMEVVVDHYKLYLYIIIAFKLRVKPQ